MHDMPLQHCWLLVHACANGAHRHCRFSQLPLQQSLSPEHPMYSATQLHVPFKHDRPVQQSVGSPHCWYFWPHVQHAPFLQLRPLQQSVDEPQVPSRPLQATAHVLVVESHDSPEQHDENVHGAPLAPQPLAQTPPTQPSPSQQSTVW